MSLSRSSSRIIKSEYSVLVDRHISFFLNFGLEVEFYNDLQRTGSRKLEPNALPVGGAPHVQTGPIAHDRT